MNTRTIIYCGQTITGCGIFVERVAALCYIDEPNGIFMPVSWHDIEGWLKHGKGKSITIRYGTADEVARYKKECGG